MKAAEKGTGNKRSWIRPLAVQVGTSSTSLAPAPCGLQLTRVLVPIDFSESSLEALRYAVAFAGEFEASICLVQVVEPAAFLNDVRKGPPAVSAPDVANCRQR